MSSIKDFVPTDDKKATQDSISQPTQDQLKETQGDYSDLVELFLSRYGEMDEDELIGEMLRLINQKKQNGTYNAQQLKDLAQRVRPFLNTEQAQKMESLLNYL